MGPRIKAIICISLFKVMYKNDPQSKEIQSFFFFGKIFQDIAFSKGNFYKF